MQHSFDGNGGSQSWRSVFSSRNLLLVFLPSDHRLAALKAISPADLVSEKFVSVSHTAAPVLRRVINNYLKRSRIHVTPAHEIDHVVIGTKRSDFRQSALASIASTRGVGLLPAYTQNFLSPSVTSRPLKGDLLSNWCSATKIEQVSDLETATFAIGRVGGSCFQEGTLDLELNGTFIRQHLRRAKLQPLHPDHARP